MKRILIVDDDKIFLNTLVSLLKSKYEVTMTLSAYEAIKLFGKDDFDLVIMDLYMSEMTGIELLDIFNALKPNVSAVLLSGAASSDKQLEILNTNAIDFIDKSVDPQVLLRRIERISNNIVDDEFLVSDKAKIKINTNYKKVLYNEEPIHVTSKEYRLLVLLLENKNQIIERSQIYQSVWGEILHTTNLRIVDIHILNLRKKFNLSTIESKRGSGYVWTE